MIRQILAVISAIVLLPQFSPAAAPGGIDQPISSIDVVVEKISGSRFRIQYRTDENRPPAGGLSFTAEDELPCATRWIALAENAEVSVTVSRSQVVEMSSDLSETITTGVSGLSSEAVSIGDEWSMRGVRFVPITFSPVIPQLRDGDFQFVQSAEIEIEIIGDLPRLSRLGTTIRKMWGDLLVNRDDPRRDQEIGNTASTYIYVRPISEEVSELLQPLIELRRLQGFNVIEMAHVGDAALLMRNIRNRHESGDYPVEYVCLVGDAGGELGVPGFIRNSSDYPYGLLEGNDPLPEAAVGRISYNSIRELERILEKIYDYETNPDMEDIDWYSRGAVAAGSPLSGYSTILVSRWVRDLMLRNNYTEVDTFWWTMGGGLANFMRNSFYRGALFVSYRGWTGMEDWSDYAASRLNNDHLPVAVLLGCNTGDYDGEGFGFTEALLRADGGAIGAIGTAGFQSRVNYNNALLAGYYIGVIEDDICRLGWTLNRAKLELFATYSTANMEMVSDHAYWTNLIGDPGTVIWRGVPRTVRIELPEFVDTGDGEFGVRVTDEDDNPISGVRVGFYKQDEITSAAYTDDDGEAVIIFSYEDVTPGDAFVTVSGDRVIPVTEEIRVRMSDQFVVYESHSIIEDNRAPHEGNGDRNVNPREVFGIQVTAINLGGMAVQPVIEFTLSSESDACTILDDMYNHGMQIQPNGTVEMEFLVRAESDFPDREDITFTIAARSNDIEWNSSFSIRGAAPRWEIVDMFHDDDPGPGAWVNLIVDLRNSGQLPVLPFSAILVSLGEFADVVISEVLYDTLAVGETVFGDESFSFMINGQAPYGISLPFELRLTSEDDYTGTVPLSVQVMERPSTMPTGPDEYGYWAIDNRDGMFSNIAPEYEWLEINPRRGGPGVNTGMYDRDEDDDKSVLLRLPFTFQYYGEEYDQLTVCTNGWAAFGDQSDYVDFRNLPIGSPQGPVAQLCVWWDDLYQPDAEAGVYYYYDEAQHNFYVEWYRMKRWIGPSGPGVSETFQLRLTDPAWFPGGTGDGDILFIYESVRSESRVDAHGTPYATVGIGNLDDTGGLQYSYWNRTAPGATPVASNSIIRFSTTTNYNYAIVYGSVTTAIDNQPVEGASVRVTPGYWTETDTAGIYRIPHVFAGEQLIATVIKDGFNPVSRELNPLNIGDSTEAVFSLTQPVIELDVEAFSDTLEDNQQAVKEFTISNTGNGELTFEIGFDNRTGVENDIFSHPRTSGGRDDRDDLWDRLSSFNATEMTGDHRILGVVFTGDDFYVSGGNNGEMTNYLYRFNRVGQLMQRIEQPCRDLWGMHDLAWDGAAGKIYGGCRGWIYGIEIEGGEVDSIPSPLIPPRGLAFDPEERELWVANVGDPIYRLDLEGNIMGVYSNRLRPYGLTWRSDDPDDCPLYIFSADGMTNMAVSKLNPETGDILSFAQIETEPGDRAGGCHLTTTWTGINWTFIAIVQNPDGDRVDFYDAGLNLSWLSVEPEEGSIEAGNREMCELTISTAGLEGGQYDVDLVIVHNATDGELRIPISIYHDSDFVDGSFEKPSSYQLDAIFPNPSNGVGMISFNLPHADNVLLSVIDQTGRRIGEIVNSHFGTGSHKVAFTAHDLPSGIYFIRMEAAREVRIRKFILLK